MASILDEVDTIVLLMFENRSFDHMLGHLSYENINSYVDGLKRPLNQYKSIYKGDEYNPYNISDDVELPFDIPHEYNFVDIQLAKSGVTGRFMMSGFVEAYAQATAVNPNPMCEPMGFFSSKQVPITSFLAQNFCVCDRWFSALPTSTQPNRTIAFSGNSSVFKTETQLISIPENIFEWMEKANIRWRVYHDGLSFYSLYPSLWPRLLGEHFKDYEWLYKDIQTEGSDTAPQVIIVEPSYQDAPHIGPDHPNDNHAPLAIGWGEDFLRRTYEAITSNPKKWERTVMVVYYDEHGGFFDHVAPPLIPYTTTGTEQKQFSSLGPRIPAIIVSPMVKKGSVNHTIFDHTSVLQFLAEKFTPGTPYSNSVDARSKISPGIGNISQVLFAQPPSSAPTPPSLPINVISALGSMIATAPTQGMGQSFELAAQQLLNDQPAAMGAKYPDLFQWRDAVAKARKI
jgi:phospholipase C